MEPSQNKSKVFFSKIISPENLAELSKLLSQDFNPGKIGIKIDMNTNKEKNTFNPEFFRQIVDYFQGTVIDDNSLYISSQKNIKEFSKYFETEILDQNSKDDELEIPKGKNVLSVYAYIFNERPMIIFASCITYNLLPMLMYGIGRSSKASERSIVPPAVSA